MVSMGFVESSKYPGVANGDSTIDRLFAKLTLGKPGNFNIE
jgi:hypothetical protein